MIRITFKDVGQGDSIILEWVNNSVEEFGIIDCNKKGKLNPTLDYIRTINPKELQLVVLSHPHRDHYSGFEELLLFCKEKRIKIKRFAHSLNHIGTDYWR